jgi:hypothetical protein
VTRVAGWAWFIVAFFFLGGIAFTITEPSIGIGQIWIAVSVVIGLVYFAVNRRADRMQALTKTGLPGTAQILEMTQTGVYINENPQVKMKLRVDAQGLAPYECEKKVTVPLIALGTLGSGRPLSVYVDPNDHQNMYVDWSGSGVAAGGGAVTPGGGPFTFAFPDGTSVDLSSDAAAQKEILDVLRANGIDPHAGTLDLRTNERVRQAVLDVVRRRGYAVPAGAGASAGAAAPAAGAAGPDAAASPGGGDERSGVERLMELQQAHDKGLIDDDEFEATKERILKSM